MKRGFTCGSFDLLHAGHMLMLKEIRSQVDFLIVGLQSDPTLDRPDKNKPVMSLAERLIVLEGCKYVDQIHVYNTEQELYDYLKDNPDNINVRFIGADWKFKKFTGIDLPLDVIFNSRTHSFSSSNLRERVYHAEKEKRNE